jgi:hypothetical protein
MITVQKTFHHTLNNPHTTDDINIVITEHTRNADRAILNTDRAILNTDRAILNTDRAILNTDSAILNTSSRTVRHVNKYLETGGGQFEHYL